MGIAPSQRSPVPLSPTPVPFRELDRGSTPGQNPGVEAAWPGHGRLQLGP